MTRQYCDQVEDEYDTYLQAAGFQSDAFSDFAGNDQWLGLDADAGKKLTGISETGRLDRILRLQKEIGIKKCFHIMNGIFVLSVMRYGKGC